MPDEGFRRVDEHPGAEYRSATANAALGIAAASPFLTVGAQALAQKIQAPKDEGPQVVIPPGTIRPEKD